jgi:hypothetical protein
MQIKRITRKYPQNTAIDLVLAYSGKRESANYGFDGIAAMKCVDKGSLSQACSSARG